MPNDQDHARTLDRLTDALMGGAPAALGPSERAEVDMVLLLLEARAAAAKVAADLQAARARAGGADADLKQWLRHTADAMQTALALVDLRVASHPAAAHALASLPLGLAPQDELRLLADARAVWRALTPEGQRPKALPN